ncbi:MAG: hypothetical protein JO168_28660 [Solirubrobacterales bacterium]|nr:hypothetical protein [Solirubrobacterales bacterium]
MTTIDGTKIKANASMDANRSYREIVSRILREADGIGRADVKTSSTARRAGGDAGALRTAEGRRQAFEEAKRRLAERKGPRSARMGTSAGRALKEA